MVRLRVDSLRKSYGELRAVDGVSFQVEAGQIFGLLGPNGAGKTTTISMVASLLRADSGQVRIMDPDSRGDVRWCLGLVPQELALAEKLTARECLRFIGRLYDLRRRELRARIERRLGEVGLRDRGDDLIKNYSGGMKRRLNIAAALLHDPVVLLMDEPTAGVDPQSRAYIFEIVEQLATGGTAVLYTTHYMEEAQRLCRRIAIMDHGQILAEGSLAELTARISQGQVLRMTLAAITAAQAERLAGELEAVLEEHDATQVRMTVPDGDGRLAAAVRAADRLGLTVRAAQCEQPSLESVFLRLTGRDLRD